MQSRGARVGLLIALGAVAVVLFIVLSGGDDDGSGEGDGESLLAGLGDVTLGAVADRRTARRAGWLPPVLFVTIRGRRPLAVTP